MDDIFERFYDKGNTGQIKIEHATSEHGILFTMTMIIWKDLASPCNSLKQLKWGILYFGFKVKYNISVTIEYLLLCPQKISN